MEELKDPCYDPCVCLDVGPCALEQESDLYSPGSSESLQISPLAGRILFKDVRYHSTNMSARILLGHVTWRYWKWNIRKEGASGKFVTLGLMR